MKGALYVALLLTLAWLQVPDLLRQGERRTALVWAALGAAAAALSILAFWAAEGQGMAELLMAGA